MIDRNWFTPTDPQLFFSRNDAQDPRLGENVVSQFINTANEFCILGYPDDEGIIKNGGRPGASQAPFEIRKYFYKMTPHVQKPIKPQLYDLGNLNIQNISLLDRHDRARQSIRQLNENSKKWISLGGGHDYGYSDA
nr:arginase family protein [Pseudobdellovibrionaceae bacterium]